MTNEPPIVPTATQPTCFGKYRPKRPAMTNPKRGKRMMNHAYSNRSPPQEPDPRQVDRPVRLVQHEEDREAHRRLARSQGDRNQREHLSRSIPEVRRERDEVEDRGVEHDLDGHQHDACVPPDE